MHRLYIYDDYIMEDLFAAVKTGNVDEVKKIINETGLPLTVCNEVHSYVQ